MTNRKPATLLVVEDELLIRLDMMSLLEQRGFAVLQATNADKAVAVLASQPEIQGVLSDIDMPGSMDGIALVKHMLEALATLPPDPGVWNEGAAGRRPSRAHSLPWQARERSSPRPDADRA